MGVKDFLEYALKTEIIKQSLKHLFLKALANFRIILGYFNSGAIGLILSAIIGKSFGLYTLIKPLFLQKN